MVCYNKSWRQLQNLGNSMVQISFLDKYCNYLQPNNDNTIMINKLICNKIKTDINLDLIKLILQTKYIKHTVIHVH